MSENMSELVRCNILKLCLWSNSLVLGHTQRILIKGKTDRKYQCDHKFRLSLLDVSAPTVFCDDCGRI